MTVAFALAGEDPRSGSYRRRETFEVVVKSAAALVFAGQDTTLWVLSPEKNVEGGVVRSRGTRRHALGLVAGEKRL
jgi:hypothetical protein